ncbi:hypothetical protein [Pseudobacteriovorax antillogorgiicola]|uniref:HDOD domain-containing protein n=1 Tax=Pseudobacteriovorax antillogorgiicola TaxID=1513793 RepID=A0A1Y6BL25_9BACT|nr:hypothetical protein [Pseudobacteriovorax antillogorgiicola]TCS56198.1 hypothetical protein EDD56_10420 [Pseudobacteriovorax antillogorgiicola]SMF08712.1 hypothetical protein SAMN06296036_104314 [Pseudobacteriovorax antillogorgiicola]
MTTFLKLPRKAGIPWIVAESQYSLDHSVLGEIGACFWAFPDQITSIIEHHHDPEPSLSPQGMVAFANQIKHYLQDQKTLVDQGILESYNKFLGIDYQAYDRFLSSKFARRQESA